MNAGQQSDPHHTTTAWFRWTVAVGFVVLFLTALVPVPTAPFAATNQAVMAADAVDHGTAPCPEHAMPRHATCASAGGSAVAGLGHPPSLLAPRQARGRIARPAFRRTDHDSLIEPPPPKRPDPT